MAAKNSTILLVEDNPNDELLTLRALEKSRIKNEVIVVRDGAEAIDFLFATGSFSDRDPHILPNVVILDLKLPKVDGHEVLRKIRENPSTKFLPVVILTSSKEEQDLIKSYQEGANSYIVKSVDLDQFTNSIQGICLYWLVLNENVLNK